jgi:glycosyltransferase involved in cell wall biosynthesis
MRDVPGSRCQGRNSRNDIMSKLSVSVIIPTYQRPLLLREAVESVWAQSVLPDEILIGDDSKDDETEQMVTLKLIPASQTPIRYFRNTPPLGQAKNVDALFQQAKGDLFTLLHDDDLFCPNAFHLLNGSFEDPAIAVAYGKQLLADQSGRINQRRSDGLNEGFYRTHKYAACQLDFFDAAVMQQFPNDGFFIRSQIAKAVGYHKAQELFGDACDFGFSILCAQNFPKMKACFVDEFTAIYRESVVSVGRNNPKNNAAYKSFSYVLGLGPDITSKTHIQKWLESRAPVAIAQAIDLGDKKSAKKWYFSKWHRHAILSPGGFKRGLKLLLPT